MGYIKSLLDISERDCECVQVIVVVECVCVIVLINATNDQKPGLHEQRAPAQVSRPVIEGMKNKKEKKNPRSCLDGAAYVIYVYLRDKQV